MCSERPTSDRPSGASHGFATGLLAALMLACGVLLGTGAPACAETAGTGPTATTITERLATDPVYVAPSYATAVNPAQRQDLVDRIATTGLPIKVVLVPLKKGDAFDGSARALASVVKERLGLRELILITTDEYGK
ncbi:hypothetical protein ACF08M_06815 [Streptomyces sp. NPDC015032]|uniref:hypothetical protein n=1 Tax=Streptomyces sp. NPDC015032 TaxID=3364937 RepID=UPI003700080A